MKKKRINYHLVWSKKHNSWRIKIGRRGYPDISGWEVHFRDHKITKKNAIKFMASFFYNNNSYASFKIHKKDGVIQEERTYPKASDPRRYKG